MLTDTNAVGLLLHPSVLRGVCTVGLFVTETGLLLHSPAQPLAERREHGPQCRRAPGPQHSSTTRQHPAAHPDLTAKRGEPTSDSFHRLLHLPSAPADRVRSQLHVTGIIFELERTFFFEIYLVVNNVHLISRCLPRCPIRASCCAVPVLWCGITLSQTAETKQVLLWTSCPLLHPACRCLEETLPSLSRYLLLIDLR